MLQRDFAKSRCSLLPTVLAAVVGSWGAAPSAHADQPAPGTVTLDPSIDYSGTGCAPKTVDAALSADGTTFSIFLRDYGTSVASNTPARVARVCRLRLTLHVPPGWQYALVGLGYLGTCNLATRVDAVHTSRYFFPGAGESPTPQFESTWTGPTDGDVYLDAGDDSELPQVEPPWSRCGNDTRFVLQTTLILDNSRNRAGNGHVDEILIEAEELFTRAIGLNFAISWRRCST